eukprot:g2590.t1
MSSATDATSLSSEKNEKQKLALKMTMDMVQQTGTASKAVTMEDIQKVIIDEFGQTLFQEVKPFVEEILYRTIMRPSSRGRGHPAAAAAAAATTSAPIEREEEEEDEENDENGRRKSGVGALTHISVKNAVYKRNLASTSSIAHVVDALVDSDVSGKSDLGEVWSRLAVSKSARMMERRESTYTGYCSDEDLLPKPVLFCIVDSEEDEEQLLSLTLLNQSIDRINREQKKNPDTFFQGGKEMLRKIVEDSFIVTCGIENAISKLTTKIGGKSGKTLWRAPMKGDDNMPISPFLGSVIDSRYIIKEFIASGSYKTCWRAHDLKTDKPVCLAIPKGAHEALKFQRELHDGVSGELAVSRGILNTGLSHIGMVNILDVTAASQSKPIRLRNGIRGRVHYIVMDLCLADLHAYLGFEKGEMPESLAKYFFRQLLDCMRYLHEKNRFHLDIKLDNVMVVFTDSTFGLKLIDFTRMTDGKSPIVKNVRVGLNSHCAPEARPKGASYDGGKQDMWSCGRLLLRMVTPVQNMAEIQHFADERPIDEVLDTLNESGVRFSKGLDDFLRCVMATDPKTRYSSARALEHPWIRGTKETPMSGPAVVAEMERRAPSKRTESQTQAVEWDRETPIASVVKTIEKFVRKMGSTHTVQNQVIVEYRSMKRGSVIDQSQEDDNDSASAKGQSITVVCEVQHKRVLLDGSDTEEWVSSEDPTDGWKEFEVPDYGRTAWMHNKTKATQWDRPKYSDVLATRVMIRWKLGDAAALWLAFVAKVGGGLNRIYCDIAAVKSNMRRTAVELLIKLRCVLLSGYLIKSNLHHNADAVSSTIAAFGRFLAFKSKLEQLTLTQESTGGETPEDMRVMEQLSVVLSMEGGLPSESEIARRPAWQLKGGRVSSGAFQLLTRDQISLANAFRSNTGEPMNREDSENAAADMITAITSVDDGATATKRGVARSVQKLYVCLHKLKTDENMYEPIDRTKLKVRLCPGPYRNRLIWLHQVLVDYVLACSQFDDGKGKVFIVHMPESEDALLDPKLFAPNIEWPSDATGASPRHEKKTHEGTAETTAVAVVEMEVEGDGDAREDEDEFGLFA